MEINLELYKVFYHVAKTLSFSQASKALFISQSAVSQAIQTLEQKLNTPLFIRSTKKVSLTSEGKLLFDHVEPAINLMLNGQLSLQESPSLSKGKLHIGASDTICKHYLIPYLNLFHQKYPGIHLQVTNRTSTACVDLLKQGIVDFIVTNLPNDALDQQFEIHPTEYFKDVFIAGNQFVHLKETTVTLEQVSKEPILMLEKNTATSTYLYKLFEQAGLSVEPSVELGSIDLLVDLAKIGLGIAFVPEYCLSKNDSELFTIALKTPLPPRRLAIATHKMMPLNLASQKFIEILTQHKPA